MVVEDGTGKSNADGYVATTDVAGYAAANGLPWDPATDQAAEAAVRVATRYVDGLYRWRWAGTRKKQREQALEWPRINAVTPQGYTISADEVPRELRDAVCELAVREAANPGTLSPDTDGAPITSITADSVSVTFGGAGYTGAASSFASVWMMLEPLLQRDCYYGASAVRG